MTLLDRSMPDFLARRPFGCSGVRDDIRVKVRYTQEERGRLTDFEQMRIRTADGTEVPLLSVADVEFAPGYSTITRTDGQRRVAVTAEVDPKRANSQEVFAELGAGFFPELKTRYPGLHISLQGEKKTCVNLLVRSR